jgi:hypothetical protein
VIKSHDVGTYIEWLILIDRVQPSFVAGVYLTSVSCVYGMAWYQVPLKAWAEARARPGEPMDW